VSPRRVVLTTSVGDPAAEYLDALREAGLEPERIDARVVDLPLADVAGVVLAGGEDVDPATYGAPSTPFVGPTEPERDLFEALVLKTARDEGIPTLCICRGLQLANAAFGGTLIDDVPRALGAKATVPHRLKGGDGKVERGLLDAHLVRIVPDTLLERIVGARTLVTGARHHQAVDRCAPDLQVVAKTDDGIVEALEARFPSPFWLAVQWHPESTRTLDNGASRKLFAAFAEVVRAR
jgi:gamma-glutamyl-gamma-aminobutyrate hydrolase PuuD